MRKSTTWNIEAAEVLLLQCAAFVDKFGPQAQPLLDRALAEYNRLREPSATERVRAMLAQHRTEATRDPA